MTVDISGQVSAVILKDDPLIITGQVVAAIIRPGTRVTVSGQVVAMLLRDTTIVAVSKRRRVSSIMIG